MAQPLFDQHPLEEYFRHTGEIAEPIPGGSPEFTFDEDDYDRFSPHVDVQLPSFVVSAIQIANDLLRSSTCNPRQSGFEERFKYDVISSSLLSSSLAAPTSAARRSFTPEIPGKLDGGGEDDKPLPATSKADRQDLTLSSQLGSQLLIALLSLAVVAMSTGFYFSAVIFLSVAVYMRFVTSPGSDKDNSTAQTLDALNELISTGNVWDSAVNEAIMLVENEERSIFYGPSSPRAPSSTLRISLRSSLHTTQTQCDNVRQLLSALTCPTSLSQLTEMYAPPSPIRPTFSIGEHSRPSSPPNTVRPFSHPTASWRQRTTSLPSNDTSKRATWNGSYAALALAGSPTAHLVNRKKQNRRSDVQSLFQPLAPFSSVSAPVSPLSPGPVPNGGLEDVIEEDDYAAEDLESKGYFGAVALDLQRKRKSAGLETFGLPPPSYTPPRSPGPRNGKARPLSLFPPTIASPSRLTSVHTTRHPLSLSGLHLALQGALSAKRYACSYLLALRFTDDEDDSYWENVRSVMALLSSTFSDASARLIEALDEAEKQRIKDEHPTPPRGNTPTPNGKETVRERCISPLRNEFFPGRSFAEGFSFAPMPSNMARFAAHVDAITSALSDAREHVHECVSALRDPPSQPDHDGNTPSVQDHPAFQAYDRLRKELGFALRECERGRERLLDILAGPRSSTETADDEDVSLNTPGLRHDSGSETSEKDPASPNVQTGDPNSGLGLTLSFGREDHDIDDATAHLLLTASSQHLPPPGVEQVFEAESGNSGTFTRPRSKVSRDERIRIMKARRESRLPPSASSSITSPDMEGLDRVEGPGRERWGPGGEVVQELKDVIWKVGERRRKMSQQLQMHAQASQREQASVPVRETSILIEIESEPPVGREESERTCDVVPLSPSYSNSLSPESPTPLPSQLPPSLVHASHVLDPDDTLRTVPQPAPVQTDLGPESRLDMS